MRVVLTGGHIFNAVEGTIAAGDVAIEEERIVGVGPGLDGDEAVDCAGLTLLPGLFDCHVHMTFSGDLDWLRAFQRGFSYQFFEAARNLRRTLDIGVTTARDAGFTDIGVKQAIESGLVEGPRLRIAVTILSQTGGHGDGMMPCGVDSNPPPYPGMPSGVVDGPDEVRARTREILRAGADQIKIASSGGVLSPTSDPRLAQFLPDEIEEIVGVARAAGTYVMAHAQSTAGIKNALRAGVRSIEHGVYLDDEAIDLMLGNDVWLVPTLMAPVGVLDAIERGEQVPDRVIQKAHEVADAHAESFRKAVSAGVRVAMGTDTGVTPHGENLRELALMSDAGMSPVAVLQATTVEAARLMGPDDDLGSLQVGKRADVVAIAGDVLSFGDLAERIHQVWKDGARLR
jgi:imidazolonepropionase-like amidohydrolase